ncbi:DUF3656 domain-containing U32 family peptidase [Thermohalobacter berrensis]|uniref:Protease n=1 Tax=Thermohalobacter berrensis TaxID=99594 RepID=A0A419T569_9FIRM|nr:U32 family peptidase [Thermohalobacter berrensis]RKD32538.1 protease [Thermohalobacter berrensis]
MNRNIELLAPAGSTEAFYAAVENGADAIYLGGKLFNARKYASNFDYKELKEALEYAHIKNVKVYVTVNILLDNSEMEEALDYISYLYNIDVDGIIVQDLGLAVAVKDLFPDLEVHGSTQMTTVNYMGVKFLEDFGFNRVVLARELSTNEINFIKNNTEMELEGFIHGALCVSFSGQCLLSSIIGGRSGNRGRCAQPCRMPYSLVDLKDNKIINNLKEKYLLSPKDLNTIDYLDEIVKAGISSLKIEGRMKRPEYVAVITNKYRKALDYLFYNSRSNITEKDRKEILQIFNRDFTKGYILGHYGDSIISLNKPSNKGVYIGDVTNIDKNLVDIYLKEPLNKGDGIVFINEDGSETGTIVDIIYYKGKKVDYGKKGQKIKIKKPKNIKCDSKVFKTSDVDLLKKAKDSYVNEENKIKIPINMAVKLSINQPIQLYIWDNDGNYVNLESEKLVEIGRNVTLNEDKVKRQLCKLGNTPYYPNDIEIQLEEGSMISLSILNKLRRRGIKELNEKRCNKHKRIQIKNDNLRNYLKLEKNNKRKKSNKISVKIDKPEQFKLIDLNKLDRLYFSYFEGVADHIKEAKKHGKEIYLNTEKIMYNSDFSKLEKKLKKIDFSSLNGISVSNGGALKFIKDRFNLNIHCDFGMNIFNSYTANALKKYGVNSLTLSPELKLNQIKGICDTIKLESEVIGYGYLPVMITKYCPLTLLKKCKSDNNCVDCKFKTGYGIVDRKGKIFEITRRENYTIIYNSYPLMVLEHLYEIFDKGVDFIRLDFTSEKEKIGDIQKIYFEYAKGKTTFDEVNNFIKSFKKENNITKGHYFRGVL